MKKIIYQALMMTAALMVCSCSEKELDTYDVQENAIRFPGMTGDTYLSGYSSAEDVYYGSYSFIEDPMEEWKEYQLPVNIIGLVSETDRVVSVKVVEDKTTAPQNAYEIMDGVIPAGEREGFIGIKIAKTEELNSLSYQLTLELQPSEDFRCGPKEYLTAVLIWNNILPAPTNSHLKRTYNMLIAGEKNFVSTSLNSYSTNAHLAIVDALGWDDWGDATVHGNQANTERYDNCYNYLPRYSWIYAGELYKAYAKKLDDYLKAYEEEHGEPLLHNGGKLEGQPVEARKY